MEKRIYTAGLVERTMRVFEERYGMSSREFFEAHKTDDVSLAEMPGSMRQAWATFCRTYDRMTESSFVHRAERELEIA